MEWVLCVKLTVATFCLPVGTPCLPGSHTSTTRLHAPAPLATYPTEALCLTAVDQRRRFADVPTLVRQHAGPLQVEYAWTSWCAPLETSSPPAHQEERSE